MDDNILKIITTIIKGPYLDDFYGAYGNKSKFYLHENFDVKLKYFYYIRQSRPSDTDDSKKWQVNNNNKLSTKNLIISNNSAFKEEKSEYIFDFIKYLVSKGNRNFKISVSDYSRFSRNLEASSKIYNFIYDNNINFYLEVDKNLYNYREDYYTKLRSKFSDCEKFSSELSREMKKVSKKRKEQNEITYNSELATNYFKSIINMPVNIDINKLNRPNLKNNLNNKIIIKNYYYFHCPLTNCMITCPEELAYIENLDYTYIKGFEKEDFLAIANSDNHILHYICYLNNNNNNNNFNMSDLNKKIKKNKKK
jgi:hypothetical protein